uniref:Cilia and flagella associated protein 46 n=1 Tax=Sphenodon punctatus TaxID=8508 RepID=A0A8D0HCF2_SPHPU
MDSLIRQQLSVAQNCQGIEALKKTYELIRSANQGKCALDSSESFCPDLYVLCAEQALQLGNLEMSSDCLQMYFKGKPPINQFLGRAYFIQFLKYLGYYFLIYNASVLYWQIVRPYLKHGFRNFLIPSLSQIVHALEQADEQDKEWRAELMIELLECFLDASKTKEAMTFSSTTASFIKDNVPDKYQQIFSLMVRHKLMDDSQIEEDIESSISLTVIYKIQTIKSYVLESINPLEY